MAASSCLVPSPCHTVQLSVVGWELTISSASSSNKGDVRKVGETLKSMENESKVLSQQGKAFIKATVKEALCGFSRGRSFSP